MDDVNIHRVLSLFSNSSSPLAIDLYFMSHMALFFKGLFHFIVIFFFNSSAHTHTSLTSPKLWGVAKELDNGSGLHTTIGQLKRQRKLCQGFDPRSLLWQLPNSWILVCFCFFFLAICGLQQFLQALHSDNSV